MKSVAKWVLIIWSVFCLIGIIAGLANVGNTVGKTSSDVETAGTAIGMGCGMGMLLVIWAAIALPALVVYLVAGKKETVRVQVEQDRSSTLCAECGKYHAGRSQFCPNCGKPVA
jgi:membrane protease subunit (stomatin/prohibitin family)